MYVPHSLEKAESNVFNMSIYHRDPTVPFWRSNTDVEQLFEAHAYHPEHAQAWLEWRYVSEQTTFEQAVMMRGRFELGLLGYHTYTWSFTPTHTGEPAIVLPVYHDCRMVDLLAISRRCHSVWGCTTGAGQYMGSTTEHREDRTSPWRVYRSPITWLLANCDGVLPLSKSWLPLLQSAPSLIAESYGHACEISELGFSGPAERLGFDCESAEQAALNKITFEVAA
jgi:hypothetical protein